jgi:hypothetical protein
MNKHLFKSIQLQRQISDTSVILLSHKSKHNIVLAKKLAQVARLNAEIIEAAANKELSSNFVSGALKFLLKAIRSLRDLRS